MHALRSGCDIVTIARLRAQVAELEQAHAEQVAERDMVELEACADLIVRLDEHGPARGNRERVRLLADWQRARLAERARQAKGDKREGSG
jgi:hypothetical protein